MPLDPLITFAVAIVLWTVAILFIFRMAALEKKRARAASAASSHRPERELAA